MNPPQCASGLPITTPRHLNLPLNCRNTPNSNLSPKTARPGASGQDSTVQIKPSHPGGARLGCPGSKDTVSPPRCSSIRPITAGVSMLAITRKRPPHCRQLSMSMANTRLRRCAQVIADWRRLPFSWPCRVSLAGSDPGPMGAGRREHAVVSGQVCAGLWYQCGEPGDKVFGFEDHVGGAVAIRRLQCIAHLAVCGEC